MGRCSSSLLTAGRAELRRTQLTRSSRRHIEGAAGCRLTTQCYGEQLRWKGWLSIYLDPQPTLSKFQVGGNRSTRRKPTTFGRALTNSSHMSVASPNRDSNPWSQRWKALALTIVPPKSRIAPPKSRIAPPKSRYYITILLICNLFAIFHYMENIIVITNMHDNQIKTNFLACIIYFFEYKVDQNHINFIHISFDFSDKKYVKSNSPMSI